MESCFGAIKKVLEGFLCVPDRSTATAVTRFRRERAKRNEQLVVLACTTSLVVGTQ